MLDPFKKLFQKSDLKKSLDLVELLEIHERTWPQVQAKYFELDKGCCEIALRFAAAKACYSPTAVALHEELRVACGKRDAGPRWFDAERNRLRNQIEKLTAPVIRAFVEQCNVWFKQIYAQKKANVLERTFDAVTDKQLVRLAHNAGVRKEATDYVKAMQSDVRSLQHRPLQEIHAKIDEVTRNVALFDLDKLEAYEMSPSFVGDFEAESVATTERMETGYLAPAPGKGGWQIVKVGP